MKEIITQQVKEVKTYRTTDGKEFNTKNDALKHEYHLWWGKNVTKVVFNDYEYYHYTVVDDEGYQNFVNCLSSFFSSDFHYLINYPKKPGTKLFARVVEYNSDYADEIVMYTYEQFVAHKQEIVSELIEELERFREKFGR